MSELAPVWLMTRVREKHIGPYTFLEFDKVTREQPYYETIDVWSEVISQLHTHFSNPKEI